MATATIASTAWVGVPASPRETQLKVWPYSLARSRRAFLVAELAMLAVALVQAAWNRNLLGVPVLFTCCALFFHIGNLDRSLVGSKTSQFWIDLLECVALGFLACAMLFHAIPQLVPRVEIALCAALLTGLLPLILRCCLRHLVAHGKFVDKILIVGTGDLPAKLRRELEGGIGHDTSNTQMRSHSESPDRRAAVVLTELHELLARDQISRVVVAELDPHRREQLAAALLDSRVRGLQVSDAVDFYEKLSGKIWVEGLNPQWFVYTHGFEGSPAGIRLKRWFDVTFALVLILLTSPLLVLIAIAIKLESAGPLLFRQVRVGLHGKTFVIYKFRSMRQDAELEAGPTWAAEHDERVTKVGRLLRILRLDEVPQAFNVLKGDMSAVGPRPERPCFVDRLEQEIPFYSLRHYLKPGITGWAQVMYRYGASIQDSYEKLQYDLYYVKRQSFCCDVAILLKTISVVLFCRGR